MTRTVIIVVVVIVVVLLLLRILEAPGRARAPYPGSGPLSWYSKGAVDRCGFYGE